MFIVIIIFAIFTAFLEASFLPTLRIAGGMIQLITITVAVLMLFGSLRYSSLFLLVSALIISIITAMPVTYFLLPNFVVLAIILFLINRRILIRPSALESFFIFFAAVVVADLVGIVMAAGFSPRNFYLILPDALYSAIVATLLYWFANKIYLYFNPQVLREEIKLLR